MDIPYKKGGHSVTSGMDCAAFVGLVLWKAGVPNIPDFYGANSVWNGDRFISVYGEKYGRVAIPSAKYFDRKRRTEYQTGDVIVDMGEHTALIIMEAGTPWVYECSPWEHYSDGHTHGHDDGTQRCRLSKRFNKGGFYPNRSARYFRVASPHH